MDVKDISGGPRGVILPFVQNGTVDETKLFGASSLYAIDEYYTRRIRGFQSVEEYLYWSSSGRLIHQ
uniref:Uncharacterized protein n=1 Tax=Romanomermis culicivorax TaxID=13658 RepID=A0A915KM57_ROMCU